MPRAAPSASPPTRSTPNSSATRSSPSAPTSSWPPAKAPCPPSSSPPSSPATSRTPRMDLAAAVPTEEWHELRRTCVGRRQLDELTLGLYGFGRIGSAMARVGAALDMRVLYNDLVEIPERRRAGAVPVSVERLLAES